MEPISATYIRSVSSSSARTCPRFDFLVSMSCKHMNKQNQKPMKCKREINKMLNLYLHFDFVCDVVMNYHYLD